MAEGAKSCRTNANVRALRALFADDDSGTLTPTALELVEPSIAVQSRRGLQPYWRLRPGDPLEPGSRPPGLDLSAGLQYRPLFIQNIVLNASLAVLFAGDALRQLYGSATDTTQYSALLNAVLTF